MSKLHIANTFFEWELQTSAKVSLMEALSHSAISRQLQFLPLLYAPKQEGILVSELPSSFNAQLRTFSDSLTEFEEIESWGASLLIAEFAEKKGLKFEMPSWEVVKQVNSKLFSFKMSPKLSHAELLYAEQQTQNWLRSFPGKKVLKTCYGVSGQGHLILGPSVSWQQISNFLQKQWAQSLPVIAEPWMERLFDFSTQWVINKNGTISYLGATLCTNDSRGQYRATVVAPEEKLFYGKQHHLDQHLQIAKPILTKIAKLGYFGHVGIDAMVYMLSNTEYLHPIVEINARKTMGWLGLQIQHNDYPDQHIDLSYTKANQGLLPNSVQQKNGKPFAFQRNLAIKSYSS